MKLTYVVPVYYKNHWRASCSKQMYYKKHTAKRQQLQDTYLQYMRMYTSMLMYVLLIACVCMCTLSCSSWAMASVTPSPASICRYMCVCMRVGEARGRTEAEVGGQ